MKYTLAAYMTDGRVSELHYPTIRKSRVEARRILNTVATASRVVIRRNGEPYEVAHRVYNMRQNRTFIRISTMGEDA